MMRVLAYQLIGLLVGIGLLRAKFAWEMKKRRKYYLAKVDEITRHE